MKILLLFIVILIFLGIVKTANAQSGTSVNFQRADSFYYAFDWQKAKAFYETLLKDSSFDAIHLNRIGFVNYNLGNYGVAKTYYQKALSANPIPVVKASIYSRLARINSLDKKTNEAFANLDSAIVSGYSSIGELDTLKDFTILRNTDRFKKIRENVYNLLNPCMMNAHAREFDFWIGEWDVYATGSKTVVGHSLIQMISGGCAILENWTSPASTGKSLNFIDNATNKWKQVWVGSYAGGIQDFVNGEYKDGAMRFTFETTNPQGQKLIGRFIFYNVGANEVRQFNETSNDDGKTWVTSYDFTYIRKK